MRKLHMEEYRNEYQKNILTLEKDLHSVMELFSYPEHEIYNALVKAKKDLIYQSITSVYGITITAKIETVLVTANNVKAECEEKTLPIYHYQVPFTFFKMLREQADMTFPEMAKLLHSSIATYISWEKDNYLPENWIQQLILEKYRLETFERKKEGKTPSFSTFPNFICT